MEMAIGNPASKVTYADIDEELLTAIDDVLLNRRDDATERLILIAQNQNTQNNTETASTHTAYTLGDMIMKGMTENLETIVLDELKKQETAVKVIEGPLMEAMNKVGELFGEGKMFLPQVVKTARTMKQAVNILQPYFDSHHADATDSSTHHVVLLATVKGDVHDIGKNIVGVVMACNNYEIIDMGVMVPAEQIVRKAVDEHVDIIGLSGLITPSLEEMVNVAKELQRAGLDIPIMIGGATTSELHVALKIAPVYAGPVVWMKDASQNALVAARLMSSQDQMEQELSEKYEHLREDYQQQQKELLSYEEAKKQKNNLFE